MVPTLMLPGTAWCTPTNNHVKVLVTEVRTTASYNADSREVQLDLTRTQRPGEGEITLTFRQDGAPVLMLEARAIFHDPRAPVVLLEASGKSFLFSASER